MTPRAAWLGLALLAAAAAILFLALRRDDGAQPTVPDESTSLARERGPGPTLEGSRKGAPSPEVRSPTAPLATGYPGDETPMGDDGLHGVIVDPAGNPIGDARVYLRARADQAAAIDAPALWNTRTDQDGRWRLDYAWAARSLLGAWAPGFERTYVDALAPDEEIRIVLVPAPLLTVTVRAPPRTEPFGAIVAHARLRIRLGSDAAVEHPLPHQGLAAEWDQDVQTDVPTLVRIPLDVHAHLTADAPGLACEPTFAVLPAVAKDIVLHLVPSATLLVRLLDATTRTPLSLEPDAWGHVAVTSTESGFALQSMWEWGDDTIRYDRGVARGAHEIVARYRGYLKTREPVPVEIAASGTTRVEVPLERDLHHAVVHLHLRHAQGSHLASTPLEHGVTLVRRREDASPEWRGNAVTMLSRSRRTLEKLPSGTYDMLVWNGGRFPAVGVLLGLVIAGGTEATHEVELKGGYGFRPTDVLGDSEARLRRVRASADLLGVLPWIDNYKGDGIQGADEEGFTVAPVRGYIGPYPSSTIRLVERAKDGSLREYTLGASISPPR